MEFKQTALTRWARPFVEATRRISAAAIAAALMLTATAALAAPPALAPVNADFAARQAQVRARALSLSGSVQQETGTPRQLGFVPSPRNKPATGINMRKAQLQALSSTTSTTSGLTATVSGGDWTPSAVTYGAQYDARNAGMVSPVKDQGSCGSCWAFATMASTEAAGLPGDLEDFSENHLKNNAGFDLGECSGGNADMSSAYLARWTGLVAEASDPYSASASSVSPSGITPKRHVQEILYIPGKVSPTDLANIKTAVTNFGTVYTTMNWVDSSYNSLTGGYYYSGTGANHAVAIVGWDDNYAKTNFKTQPPGNGAFLIKNSWGSWWGQSGYFWASYFDSIVGTSLVAFSGVESTTNYDSMYQYDPLGATTDIGYGSATAWGANIFTATATEQISAVSFYTSAVNSGYEIYVYTGVNAGQPRSGTLASTKTGTIVTPGYHTISLDTPASVSNGQRFSVVIKFNTPGYNYPISIEYPFSGYSSRATASAGQGFVSADGNGWSDMAAVYSNTSVCIKAFGSINAPAITLQASPSGSANVTSTVSLQASVSGDYEYQFLAQDPTGAWHTIQAYSASNSASWNTNYYPAGKYTLRVWIRAAGTTPPGGYDYRQDLSYTLNPIGPATGATIRADKLSPQQVGSSITLTGQGSGGSGVYEYQFISVLGSTSAVIQDWSSSASAVWNTAGKMAGTYTLAVRVRAAGSAPAGGYDKAASLYYTLSPLPAASGVTVTPSATRVATGATLTLTAAGKGGTGSYEYAFYQTTPSGVYSLVQNWGTSNTFTWNSSNQPTGTWTFLVKVRSAGTLPVAGYDAYASVAIFSAKTVVTSFTASPAGYAPVTSKITLTANATSATGTTGIDYLFYEKAPGSSTWTLSRTWGANTLTWDSTGKAAGTWQFTVTTRLTGTLDSAGRDDAAVLNYTLTPLAPATGVTLTRTPDQSKVASGNQVVLTATGKGGTGNYEYAFYQTTPGGVTSVIQPWGAANTYTWNTAGSAAGTWGFVVKVRTAGTAPAAGYDAYATTSIFTAKTVLTSFTTSPVGYAPVTSKVTLTATAVNANGDGSGIEYLFYEKAPGSSTWNVSRTWGANTLTWDSTGKAAGTWQFTVATRLIGTPDGRDDAAALNFILTPLASATGVTLTPSSTKFTSGTPLVLTAAGKGGTGNYEYAFYQTAPGSTATLVQNWGSSNTLNWDSSNRAAGNWTFTVKVRTAGTAPAAGYDSYATTTVFTAKTLITSFTASPSGSAPVTSKVTFSVTGTGSSSIQYLFYEKAPGSTSSWVVSRTWGADTFVWDSTGKAAGAWQFMVVSRVAGTLDSAGRDDVAALSYTLTALPQATGTTLTPSATTLTVGGTLQLTASGQGGTGSYEYAFYQTSPSGAYSLARNWGTSNSYSWNSAGQATGSWKFLVKVRSAGTLPAAGYDAYATTAVSVTR